MTDEEQAILDELYRLGEYDNPPKPQPRTFSIDAERAAFPHITDMLCAVLLERGDVKEARQRVLEALEQVETFHVFTQEEWAELIEELEQIAIETGRV